MEIKSVKVEFPEGANIILGHAHFIKTPEDLYEVVATRSPQAKFGVAFSEASGPCLVRVEGNDETLRKCAAENALRIGAGHLFVIVLSGAFPISIMDGLRNCQEVCGIFAATANPVEVIVASTKLGGAVLGVVDGSGPKGVESGADRLERKEFLRKIGYKL